MSREVKKLLQKSELESLFGKKSSRLIMLASILTLTLLAISFSNGGLDYLDKKMNDPYTNWVNLRIPRYVSDSDYAKLKKDVLQKDNVEEYNLGGISEYVTFKEVFTGDGVGDTRLKGRTVSKSNPIYSKVISKDNMLYSKYSEIPFGECGLIIKESTLISLGYTDPTSQDFVQLSIDSTVVLFDVWGVVKNLPDNCDFITSPGVHNLLFESISETDFLTNVGSVNKITILGDAEIKSEDLFKQIFSNTNIRDFTSSKIYLNKDDNRVQYTLKFSSYLDAEYLETKKSNLAENQLEVFSAHNCNIPFTNLRDAYYLSFNFLKLDNIRPFKNYLSDEFNIELEMSQVESKENFAFVSRLSLFISTMLLVFGLLSIVFFINNTLMMYLKENSQNLGTLKAFGLDNKTLISIYLSGMIRMFLYALLVAVGVCILFELVEAFISGNNSIFKFFDVKTYLSILILAIATYFVVNKILKTILSSPPGDLIYGRT